MSAHSTPRSSSLLSVIQNTGNNSQISEKSIANNSGSHNSSTSNIQEKPGKSTGDALTPYGAQVLVQNAARRLANKTLNAATLNQTSSSDDSTSISSLFRRKRIREENTAEENQSESDEEIEPPKKQRFGVRYAWPIGPEHIFDSFEECDAFIKNEDTWTHVRDRVTKKGYRGVYRCSGVEARGENCSACICTIFGKAPGDETYELYRLPNEHDCKESANKVNVLSEQVKELLTAMLDDGKTLLKILDVIRKRDIVQPEKKQIESFIKSYRKKRFGDAKITVQQFLTFAQAHFDVPDDIDEPFVLDFDHSSLNEELEENEEGE